MVELFGYVCWGYLVRTGKGRWIQKEKGQEYVVRKECCLNACASDAVKKSIARDEKKPVKADCNVLAVRCQGNWCALPGCFDVCM